MVQVAMDGPNVNMKFLEDLNDEIITSPRDPKLLDLGTCGLHTINCAFKSAIKVTDWQVVQFLKAVYYLFKDIPSRRADYTHYSGSTVFPKKFCYIRWTENSDVAKRAIEILPHIVKFVESAIRDKQKYSCCNNFKTVSQCIRDSLFGAKLAFFQSLSYSVEPFLVQYQSNDPLSPFLYESLNGMVLSILQKFVKPSVLKENCSSVHKINVFEKNNLIPASEIELSFIVKDELRKIKKKKAIDILNLRQSCRKAYQSFLDKLFKRSPLRFPLTKAISFLDPAIFLQTDFAVQRLTQCLEIFVSKNRMSGVKADKLLQEFKKLLNDPLVMNSMKAYRIIDSKLDNHWMSILDQNQASNDLISFVRLILILSHGNSFLERGFSINSECIIENQTQESLVALRHVYEAINKAGGVEFIEITKSMIQSVKLSHSRYTDTLKRKKEEEKNMNQMKANQKRVIAEIKSLEQEKMKVMAVAQKEAAQIEDKIRALRK